MAGALGEQQEPTTKSTIECQTREEHIAVWLGARWQIRSDMVRKYMLAVSGIITLKAVMRPIPCLPLSPSLVSLSPCLPVSLLLCRPTEKRLVHDPGGACHLHVPFFDNLLVVKSLRVCSTHVVALPKTLQLNS